MTTLKVAKKELVFFKKIYIGLALYMTGKVSSDSNYF